MLRKESPLCPACGGVDRLAHRVDNAGREDTATVVIPVRARDLDLAGPAISN